MVWSWAVLGSKNDVASYRPLSVRSALLQSHAPRFFGESERSPWPGITTGTAMVALVTTHPPTPTINQ
ncbi:hypothetical protein GGTG_08147 [Gaeumannomyces tritici R3-111a-1]|uniref:Uncharacterized protein n=1 Tax=Gaeumannomyces tritici (strain R3-111a-1) TaxID=644352 RepID=J3P3R0_GAET3|nr:hypothetical protein GGTG_08147 [Gaeumannomyces tritici R3-111a-1]EJT74304.1 hypothetical protein GGTG_08147 [Gaeumannomyces tritici R3-111a-1]